MPPPFSSMGIFLGYCDHSAAIKQTRGNGFSWPRIQHIRQSIRDRCAALSPSQKSPGTFEPRFASCFGHSDDILFMQVDSFSDAVQLTSGISQLENYTMAHCFNENYFPQHLRQMMLEPSQWIPQLEDSTNQPPLKMVTHIKLSGILTLAFGLNAQLAASSLVAETIYRVIQTLSEQRLRQQHDLLFGSPIAGIDLFKSFRLSLLAPVGSDDIVLIMHSHNYSLSASALAAIRCLTLGELFKRSHLQNDGLAQMCRGQEPFFTPSETPSDCPRQFLALFARLALRNSAREITFDELGLPREIAQNHLLAASYTTLAVDCELSKINSLNEKISGYAAVQANADINPGHELETGKKISELWEEVNHGNKFFSMDDYRFVLPGKHDLSLYFNSAPVNEQPRRLEQSCIQVGEFFDFVGKLFSPNEQEAKESGFQDISTNLAIPIPRIDDNRGDGDSEFVTLAHLFQRKIDYDEHVNTMQALDAVSKGVCSDYLLDNPAAFEKMLLDLELNATARSAAHRLFSEFGEAIGDPIHIDSVVDLSDAFHALYTILESHSFSKEQASTNLANNQADAQKTRNFFVEAIDGLAQALLLRKGSSSVKREERFGDLQGSITSLLGAGDTAIKSSLGLLRHRLSPTTNEFLENRKTVSGLIAPVLRERATASQFVSDDLTLTLIKMDRMHVFNPAHLVRVLHEVAHLCFEKLVRPGFAELCLDTTKAHTIPLLGKLAVELFAEKITQVVIFGDDHDLYVHHQLHEFMTVQSELQNDDGVGPHNTSSILPIVQVIHRFFLVVAFDEIFNDTEDVWNNTETHAVRFGEFLERWKFETSIPAGHCFDSFAQICKDYAIAIAVAVVPVIKLLNAEVKETLDVLQRLERGKASSHQIHNQVRSILVDQHLPLPLVKLDHPIDEGLAVFALIRAHIGATVKRSDTTPADRQNRFALSGNVLKSLWHISTRQKRRRLADLLDHAAIV